MAKYRIEYNKGTCIGVGACASSSSEFWVLGADRKADIAPAKKPRVEGDMQYLDFDEKDLTAVLQSAEVCPVFAIKVLNLETGEVLFPK